MSALDGNIYESIGDPTAQKETVVLYSKNEPAADGLIRPSHDDRLSRNKILLREFVDREKTITTGEM